MKIKIPDNCGLCANKKQIDSNRFICNMPTYDEKDILDISAFEVSLDSRADWCPINEIVNKVKKLPKEDKILFDRMCDGFSAMFELINNWRNNTERREE